MYVSKSQKRPIVALSTTQWLNCVEMFIELLDQQRTSVCETVLSTEHTPFCYYYRRLHITLVNNVKS